MEAPPRAIAGARTCEAGAARLGRPWLLLSDSTAGPQKADELLPPLPQHTCADGVIQIDDDNGGEPRQREGVHVWKRPEAAAAGETEGRETPAHG